MNGVIIRFGISWTWRRLQIAYAGVSVVAAILALLSGPDWYGLFNAFIAGFALGMTNFCAYAAMHRRSFDDLAKLTNELLSANAERKPTTH
jgi:uncharacterized membrane protein YjjP (DUF1212 family)